MPTHSSPPTINALNSINSFSIRLCPSGVFHLQFGFFSINVTEEVFMKIAETMNMAAADVRRMRSPAQVETADGCTNIAPTNVIPLRH